MQCNVFFSGKILVDLHAIQHTLEVKPRNSWSSELPLSSYNQQPCLFACSTGPSAPFSAVSTQCSHKRDQSNNASCCCQNELRTTYSAKRKRTTTPNSLYDNKCRLLFYRFPNPNNSFLYADPNWLNPTAYLQIWGSPSVGMPHEPTSISVGTWYKATRHHGLS